MAESSAQAGFRLQEAFYGSLMNCFASNSSGHGVSVGSGSTHVLVRRLIASDSGRCGVSLDSGTKKTESVLVSDLYLQDSRRAGVCLDGVYNVGVVRANITSLKSDGSTCYDVRNVHSFSVSDDSTCRVRSRMTYNADNSTSPEANATVSVDVSVPLALPSPQKASRGCPGGIGDRDICCPLMCRRCDCRVKLPGDYCCYDQIKQSGVSCAFVGAPCILGM